MRIAIILVALFSFTLLLPAQAILTGNYRKVHTAGTIYRPTTYAIYEGLSVTNPAYAYDADINTYAYIVPDSTGGSIVYGGFPSVVTSGTKTFYFTWAAILTSGISLNTAMTLSVDGGSTWSAAFTTATMTAAKSTYTNSTIIPSGTNLANVEIRILTDAISASGIVLVYDLHIQ